MNFSNDALNVSIYFSKGRPDLNAALNQIGDFYLELKWEFSSWVPLLSKILPNDICKIYKLGSKIRLDSTLIDFNEMHWQRGDISFIFRVDQETMITAMDNESKCYQIVRTQETEHEIHDEIDMLMMSDIVNAKLNTKNISFTPVKTGWLIKADKKEQICQYTCDVYHVNNLVMEQRKRREHLNSKDLQKNKTSIVESLTKAPIEMDPNVEVRIHVWKNLELWIIFSKTFSDFTSCESSSACSQKHNMGRVH